MYFSRTFKALNFDFQVQGLSRCVPTLTKTRFSQHLRMRYHGIPIISTGGAADHDFEVNLFLGYIFGTFIANYEDLLLGEEGCNHSFKS